ncbi:hypothetical protein CLRAG_15420 [Clostridium ragsdalei P11]|uniref:DUF4097 domain-containing protein n=1 Tax=Clostridium ragsdalei P11 TaxID=1353534 RepID=A0A1A6AWG4_9CLOT|nr:DUF4097 domain-containing protein [Clostridium ragsdalei]OBR94375.1 hypothetical protein CLRAG_15420 [Clostridium ragsdalei P11]
MNRNRSLIKVLIVMWAVIAAAGLSFLLYGFSHGEGFPIFEYGNKIAGARYAVQKSESTSVNNCSKISLGFSRGDVIVQTTDELNLKVVQSASRKLKDGEKFAIEKQGNSIEIKRKDENKVFHNKFINIFDGFNGNEKIELYVPKSYAKDLDISTTSGDILFNSDMKLNDINCIQSSGDFKMNGSITGNNVGIKTISGDIDIASLDSKYYNIQVSSGDISVKSISGSGNAKAVSGDIKMNYKSIDEYAKANSTSGDVKMVLPQNLSFKFEGKCTSGDIKGDFPLTYENNRKSKASAQVGNGPYKTINVGTVSGDIDISSK